MEIFILIGLLFVGILVRLLKKRNARNKDFINVSKRIDELERRI